MSARQGPMHNFHPPQRANAPDAQARNDRCQNRPHVQRTNIKCSLGKNRCTTSICLKGPTRQLRMLGKTDAKTDHTSRGPTQSARSARTDAQPPSASKGQHASWACSGRPMQNRPHVQRTSTMCSLGENRCTTSISLIQRAIALDAHARKGPMQNTTGAPMT